MDLVGIFECSVHGPGLSRLQQRQPGLAAEVLCRDVILMVPNVSGCCGKNTQMHKHAAGTLYLVGSNEEVELKFSPRWVGISFYHNFVIYFIISSHTFSKQRHSTVSIDFVNAV